MFHRKSWCGTDERVIIQIFPVCCMAAAKKTKAVQSLNDAIPGLIAAALARDDDVLLTSETDPGSGRKTLHVMTGKLVTACMFNRLRNRIEAFPEDGGTIVSGKWR
jgi:hypothetical protein